MGFKRTSEGRVFFQGADEEEAQTPTPKPLTPKKFADIEISAGRAPQPRDHARQAALFKDHNIPGAKTQAQIVTLLKTLNERLKVTQGERDKMMREVAKYRTTIENLEEKAERSERIALDLEARIDGNQGNESVTKELTETRRMLAALDQKQTRQTQVLSEKITKSATHTAALTRRLQTTETKQAEIGEQVQGAIAQQSKLIRKVDKAIEDRARFMRKIERIEETVIQTRDSLNAKAMVVLADQSVAGQGAAAITDDDFAAPQREAAEENYPSFPAPDYITEGSWYQRISSLQAASILSALILIGVLVGLFLNQNINQEYQGETVTIDTDRFGNAAQTPSYAATFDTAQIAPQTPALQTPSLPDLAQDVSSLTWEVEESPPAPEVITSSDINDANDDIGAIDLQDEAQVEALLEENPKKIAQELNKIEPQRAPPVETATAPPPPSPAAPIVETVSQGPQRTENELRTMLAADGSLPNVVKSVETQAFQGIAEAQHDLAAIYTAGHGGVEKNYERAAFWFERAAENGVANAGYNLGVLHHQGLGVDANIEKAMNWYEDAAAKNHPEAQYNLGIAYIEGIGVAYNPQRASEYFAAAAQNGIVEAAYNLGLVYENGLLGAAQPQEALRWYKLAADQGNQEAKQALDQLSKTVGTRINEAPQAAPQNIVPTALATKNATNDQATIAQIQEYLMASGLYPGPADGVSGALTEDAIRSYQSLNGIETNGQASAALLSHMLGNGNGLGSR
ncbi:MAG: peptidoglycan-binding protein [Alphaproteobacteria bacterium]